MLLYLPIQLNVPSANFKLVKTRLRRRISDSNLAKLMRIAIEAPDLTTVDLNVIIDVFKEKNHRINL